MTKGYKREKYYVVLKRDETDKGMMRKGMRKKKQDKLILTELKYSTI